VSGEGYRRGADASCAEKETEYSVVDQPKKAEVDRDGENSKCPHLNEEISFQKLRTVHCLLRPLSVTNSRH